MSMKFLIQSKKQKIYLMSVIKHIGESGSNGHFISYFRNSVNQRFFCYNDASVSEVSVDDAIKTKISHNESEDVIPYIFPYTTVYGIIVPEAEYRAYSVSILVQE